MATIANELRIDITGNSRGFNRSMAAAESRAVGFSARASASVAGFAKKARKAFGAFAIATGAAAAYSTREFVKFERGMAQVGTLTDLKNLSVGVLETAFATGQTNFTAMTKGLYDTVSASIDAAKSIDFLRVASEAAMAGATDTATSVDGLTSIVNSYGNSLGGSTDQVQQAKVAADIFFNTIKYGKTTFAELAPKIGQVSALAAQANISFGELGAGIATLTLGGIKSDTAMVYLKQILTSVIKPTDEAAKEAQKLGLQFDLAALKAKGLQGFLSSVKAAVGDNTKSVSALFGNIRALTGTLALTGNLAGKYAQLTQKITTETGSAAKAAEKMKNTFGFKIDQITAYAKAGVVSFGKGIANAISDAVGNFGPLNKGAGSFAQNMRDIEAIGKVTGGALVFAFNAVKFSVLGNALVLAKLKQEILSFPKDLAILGIGAFADKKTQEFMKKSGYTPSVGRAFMNIFRDPETVRKENRSRATKYFSGTETQKRAEQQAGAQAYYNSLLDQVETTKSALGNSFGQVITTALANAPAKGSPENVDANIRQKVMARLKGQNIGDVSAGGRKYDFSGQSLLSPELRLGKTRIAGGRVKQAADAHRQEKIDTVLKQVLKEAGRAAEFERRKTNFLLERLIQETAKKTEEKKEVKKKRFFISVDGKTVVDR